MDELKRRDKLYVTIFALSALVMMIANPEDLGVRSVAFDGALVLVFIGGFFWLMSELSFQLSSLNELSVVGKPFVRRTRSEMIDMVGESTGIRKEILHSMSDIELDGLMVGNGNGGIAANGGFVPLHKIVIGLLRAAFKVVKWTVKTLVGLPKAIAGLPARVDKTVFKLEKEWQDEITRK